MIKIFYSGTYKVRHEEITKDNIYEKLKDDVRSKIVGDVVPTIYASDGVVLKNNKNVTYIGGFYYEKQDPTKSICENVVNEELKQIDSCDLIIANLTKYSAIASITEVIYAAFKQKNIVVFCDPEITSYEVEGEYWFPLLAIKKIDPNVKIKFIKDEDEIIKFVNELEVVK